MAKRTAEEIRAQNRERQRRYRQRQKEERDNALTKGKLADLTKARQSRATTYREDVPAEQASTILETLGYPGRRSRTMFITIDDPVLQEWRGAKLSKTIEKMLLDPIISGAVDRLSLVLKNAEWSVAPGVEKEDQDPTEEAIELSNNISTDIDSLYPGWQSTVADSAEAYVWGFHVAEILFRKRDDGWIGWRGFMPIVPSTVKDWRINKETGQLEGVYQLPEDQPGRWLPSWKLLHFRSKPAAGRPEGKSVARNVFLTWGDKQELRRITKIGIRRDMTGTADFQVPEKILAKTATNDEKELRAAAESLVREFEQDRRQGIVRPAEETADGKPTGWKFGLIQSPGTRQIPLKEVWELYNNEIALGLMFEFMLLGTGDSGSWALGKEKSTWLGKFIESFLDGVAEYMNVIAIPKIIQYNPRYENVARPVMKHGGISEADMLDLAKYFQALAAGGLVTPDPELEKFLRRRGGAPESVGEEEM